MKESKLFALSLFCLVSGFAVIDSATAQPEEFFKDNEHRVHMRKRLKEADKNGDGKISKSEFVAQAEKKFSHMDQDGDGYLTREEMKTMRDKRRNLRKSFRGRFENSQPPHPPEGDF